MKLSSRPILRLAFALLLAGGVIAIVMNQRSVTKMQAENLGLLGEQAEARRLELENQDIPRLRQMAEDAEKLRQENQALPKLRNEVGQLRRQAGELAALRAENQRLLASGKALTHPEAPVRSGLKDAGLGTPEAAIHTFFWAMRQGDVERLRQCTLDGTQAFQGRDVETRLQDLRKEWSRFPGFFIVSKEQTSPDTVSVSLESVEGGSQMQLPLRRVGNEWKLER